MLIFVLFITGFFAGAIQTRECAMPDLGSSGNPQSWYCPTKCTCTEYEEIKNDVICQTPACDYNLRCINWYFWCIYKWR